MAIATLRALMATTLALCACRSSDDASEVPITSCEGSTRQACQTAVARLVEQGQSDDAVALLQGDCDRLVLDSCIVLGLESREGGRLPLDLSRSIGAFNKADVLHSVEAAFYLAEAHRTGLGTPVNVERARFFFERACSGDYEPACYDLGILLTQGEVPVDGETAGRAFMASCGMGNAAACLNVGSLIEHGLYTPPEPHTIASLKARACELAPEDACD